MVNVAPPGGTVSLASSCPWWPWVAPAVEGGNSATLRRANRPRESPGCLCLAWWEPSRAQSIGPWLVRTRLPGTRTCDSAQSGRTSGAGEVKYNWGAGKAWKLMSGYSVWRCSTVLHSSQLSVFHTKMIITLAPPVYIDILRTRKYNNFMKRVWHEYTPILILRRTFIKMKNNNIIIHNKLLINT